MACRTFPAWLNYSARVVLIFGNVHVMSHSEKSFQSICNDSLKITDFPVLAGI
jgi:hypothetical protein